VTPAGPRIAVVDLGSNSVRLFLCDGLDAAGPRGERRTTVTALRRGAAADGSLSEDALGRLDACLADYAGPTARFRPDRVIVVGTSAVRDAPNRDRVARILDARLGAELTVLGGEDEALCSFAGARLGADGSGEIMVIDIGGASTELVRGGPGGPEGAVSLQLGAVRQTERHIASDPPAPRELAALREEAGALVRGALQAIGGPAAAVGVAGTITTLAAVDLGAYDPMRVHGHRLPLAVIRRITAALAGVPAGVRAATPGLEPARAGVIVAGAVIASAVLEEAGLEEMTVSERDLLDGVVLMALDPSNGLFRS
jgi:exopolyphosphatase/guanosine-5'-triphosphate,3'-diphosphate pyrophosphatase